MILTVYYVNNCLSFCPFLTIGICILLRFMTSDHPFSIFKLSSEAITHPSFASFFVCEIKNNYNVVTNSKKLFISYNWQSGCPNYQMTAFVFFIFKPVGEGEELFEGDSTWLIHYKKKRKKHKQPPSCIVKFLQIMCSSCIRLILVIL